MQTATIPLSNDSDILTMDEAAEILKLTRRTVQTLIKRGDLRAYRASQKIVRLFRRDVNKFLEKYATTTNE